MVFTGLTTQPKHLKQFGEDVLAVEERLVNTPGITHTIVGFNFWMETTLGMAGGAIASGTLYTTGNGNAAYILREDYAKACAAALVSSSTTNAKYEVTGPEAIDRRQLADLLTKGLGLQKPIEIKEVPYEELVKMLVDVGVPEPSAHLIAGIDQAIANGNMAPVGDDFNQITGKQPETFASFIGRNKARYKPRK